MPTAARSSSSTALRTVSMTKGYQPEVAATSLIGGPSPIENKPLIREPRLVD
jgi:hypothetical protein